MCLLLVAHATHHDYRLVVAANRDEFHARPADAARYWDDAPAILGGRDREGTGTWLAVNRHGAFAAITNVRSPVEPASPRSRGLIVKDYLTGGRSAGEFVRTLSDSRTSYNGFNVIASDGNDVAWYSNVTDEARTLEPGVYGLSNHLLDTPWPKVLRLKHAFDGLATLNGAPLVDALFAALSNEQTAPDPDLPETGLELAHERVLSPIFINGAHYGTRCSTVVLLRNDGVLTFIERRFGPSKAYVGEQTFTFEIESGAT